MDSEQSGGGFLTSKFMGLPVIVWVGLVAVGAYFFISRSSSGSASTTGGGGTATESGTTQIQKGAIQIHVTQAVPKVDKADNPQPKPPVHKKIVQHHKHEQRGHPHHPPVKHPVRHPPRRTPLPMAGGGNAGGNERPPVQHRDKIPHNFRTKWGRPPAPKPKPHGIPLGGPGGKHIIR